MYVVTGATGNTGKGVAQGLLEAGKKIRVIGRSSEKLKTFTEKGAEAFTGNLENPDFMKRCLEGAKAVYALIPLDITAPDIREYQNKVAEALSAALKSSSIEYVVSLSGIGAQLKKDGGIVQGLHDMEQKFDAIAGISVLHLRAANFLENLYGQIGIIKQMGVMGSSVKEDLPHPMVATKDISALAVKRLLALDFKGPGNVAYVLGARDYTFREIAHTLGKAIGMPGLQYKEFPPEQEKQGIMQYMGASESMADALVQFHDSTNKQIVMAGVNRSAENTTPTSLNDFSVLFQRAYAHS